MTALERERAYQAAVKQELAESYAALYEKEEQEMRDSMTPAQLRDYRIFQGEIAERCPGCGKTDVEIEHKEAPDMIGETYWVHYECCGHDGEARNSHCEYDSSGKIVDIG
jgi:hypothetical protein